MNSSLFRFRKPSRHSHRHRRLRAEALEGRAMLSATALVPFSVVLLDQPASNGTPPDPCIQFSPQPLVSAATSNAAVQWQGQFSETLKDSSPISTAAPAAWLVDVVYSLTGQPAPIPVAVVKGTPVGPSYAMNIAGTAHETLTPIGASGGQAWVSDDTISSHITVSQSIAASPVANSFTFVTDTAIRQSMTPLFAVPVTAPAATAVQTWIANTTTVATGTVTESPSLTSGTLSINEQINQTLAPMAPSSALLGPVWTICASFVGGGTFQETPPVTAAGQPSGTLAISGSLTGTVSPPSNSMLPTRLIDSQVTATVEF